MKQNDSNSMPTCSFCANNLTVSVLNNIPKYGNIYSILECLECRIAVTYPFPSEEELIRLYSCGNYRTNTGKRFGVVIEYLVYLSRVLKRTRINKYVRPGRILDIGCGRGLFLDVMRNVGWNAIGTELNKETASYARKVYGLEILTGDLIKHKLDGESLDAININQVLEHLKNPNEILIECRRLLRKDGLLLISVPDLRSLQFVIGKENWFLLDLPFHLFHFTEEGLVDLLKTHGFEIRRIKRFSKEYSPFGWLQTLLNTSGIPFNLLYNLLKSKELRDERFDIISPLGIVATALLLPIYLPLAVIFSIVEPLFFKRSESIDIFAIKKQLDWLW